MASSGIGSGGVGTLEIGGSKGDIGGSGLTASTIIPVCDFDVSLIKRTATISTIQRTFTVSIIGINDTT